MSSDTRVLEKTVRRALSGKGAHVEAQSAFAGLRWKHAGTERDGAPHTVFQLLNHMIYWQEWVVKWLDGQDRPIPRHASGSWPGRAQPASAEEWKRAVARFRKGLGELNRRSRRTDVFSKHGKKTRLEMLHTLASHNSYHVGQVVLLRQMLGAWPPPSGGLTW